MKKHLILFSSVLVFGAVALTIGGTEVGAEEKPAEVVAETSARVDEKADFYDNKNIGYKVTNAATKEVKITSHYNNGLSENVNIPEKVTNSGVEYTVVEIDTGAMALAPSEKDTVKSVTIPKSVKLIGSSAFLKRKALESITFSEGLESIGTYAFKGTGLKSVSLPKTLETLGNQSFMECESLASVTIRGAKTIGNFAFQDCISLTNVSIADGVEIIGNSAFRNCSSLTSVTLPSSLTSIGGYAFSNASALKSVAIPNSVKSIGSSTFEDCASLTQVTIADGVETIGSYAFTYATSLKSIIIPNSVKTIGDAAFLGASSLSNITLPNSLVLVSNSLFRDCISLKTIKIPDTVSKISSHTFTGSGLTKITMPTSLVSKVALEAESFYGDYLEEITFTSSIVDGIHSNVFKAPIKDGYIFEGWANSNGTTYRPDTLSTPAIQGNTTLTAKWKQGPETPKPSTGISDATIKLLEKQEVGAVSFGAIATDAKMVFNEIILDGTSKTTSEQTASKIKVTDTRANKNTGWKVGVNYKDTNYIDKKMNLTLNGSSTNASVVSNVSLDKTKKNLFTGGTAKASSYEVKLNPTLTIPADFKATGNQTTQIEWTLEMDVQ